MGRSLLDKLGSSARLRVSRVRGISARREFSLKLTAQRNQVFVNLAWPLPFPLSVRLALTILLDSPTGREQTLAQHLSEEHTLAKEVQHPLRQGPFPGRPPVRKILKWKSWLKPLPQLGGQS